MLYSVDESAGQSKYKERVNISTSYAPLSRSTPWNIPLVTCVPKSLYKIQRLKLITKFRREKVAAHDGKVEYFTVEHTTVFLHSDWLYFLLHGINCDTTHQNIS